MSSYRLKRIFFSCHIASESCIKGHRSSGCKHNDRPLFEVKRKGRPITQCEHCRELRKTKQVHVKCMCEGTPNAEASPAASVSGEASSVSSASSIGALSVKSAGKKRGGCKVVADLENISLNGRDTVKKPLPEAAFPIGLPSETIEASAALQILSEGGYPSEDVNGGHTPSGVPRLADKHCSACMFVQEYQRVQLLVASLASGQIRLLIFIFAFSPSRQPFKVHSDALSGRPPPPTEPPTHLGRFPLLPQQRASP
jgi:hypothetical protein